LQKEGGGNERIFGKGLKVRGKIHLKRRFTSKGIQFQKGGSEGLGEKRTKVEQQMQQVSLLPTSKTRVGWKIRGEKKRKERVKTAIDEGGGKTRRTKNS